MLVSIIVQIVLTQLVSAELFNLTLKNYSNAKTDHLPLVVLYYGSDRNSLRFQQEFQKIAEGNHEILKKSSLPSELTYGQVDGKVEATLLQKTQISDLPAVYLFLNRDKKEKYTGGWNAQSFINWIKILFRDNPEMNQFYPSALITKHDQLEKKIQMFYQVAILVTPDFRLAPLKAFTAAIKQLPDGFVFCHVHDTRLARTLNVEKDESKLLVYSKIEDTNNLSEEDRKKWTSYTYKFEGDIQSSEEQLAFIQLYTWKGFFYVDDTKFQKLSHRKDMYPTIILLYNKLNRDHDIHVDAIQKARYSLVRKAALGLLDINGDAKDRIQRLFQLNLTLDDSPKLIALKPINQQDFYKYIDNTTLDALEFYEKMTSNQIQPFYKAQKAFPENELYDKSGILKLTRDTYKTVIEEKNKLGQEVLITYTAKECEPCKAFLPDFQSVARNFKDVLANKIIFARIDVELNELDNVKIQIYPHIRLYQNGVDGFIQSQSDYSEEQLVKWIQEKSKYGDLLKPKSSDL